MGEFVSPVFDADNPPAPSQKDSGENTRPDRDAGVLVETERPGGQAPAVPVEQGYQLWAPTYDRDPNPLVALEERQLKPLLPDLRGKDALDLACGTGRWLEPLLRGGARSGWGVDLSSAMLARAAAKFALRGRLVRADCLGLPLASEAADLLICSFALAHLPELPPLARELARVARPRADLFVTDVHPDGYWKGWQTAFRAGGRTVRIETHAHPVDEVRRAFGTGGFGLVRLIEARLDAPEWPIFVRAGKARRFNEARDVPAVVIGHFRRRPSD